MIFDAGVPPYNANLKKQRQRSSFLISFLMEIHVYIGIHLTIFQHFHSSKFHAVFNAKYAYSLIFIFVYGLKAVAQEGRFNRKKPLFFAWMDVALAQRYLCSSKYRVKSGGRKNFGQGIV